jgi:hypothetical protein
VHNETFSVVAMRVCNPDRSPAGINSSHDQGGLFLLAQAAAEDVEADDCYLLPRMLSIR